MRPLKIDKAILHATTNAFLLDTYTQEFKDLAKKYLQSETLGAERGKLRAQIKTLLKKVKKMGDPAKKLTKRIEDFLQNNKLKSPSIKELIDKRSGIKVVVTQPVISPPDAESNLVNLIGIRGGKNIPMPTPHRRPNSPWLKLKLSTEMLSQLQVQPKLKSVITKIRNPKVKE